MDAHESAPGSAPSPAPREPASRWWHVRPALTIAFVLSLVIHAVLSLVPDDLGDDPASTPLSTTIRELPPPPVASAAPAPPAPKPRPRRAAPAATPAPVEPTREPAPATEPVPEAAASLPREPEPEAAAVPPVLAEDVASAEPPVVQKVLPPRVDLAYRVYFGSGGLWIGSATYRFEHADNRYRIATVGEARGLAALLFRGKGRMESRGVITAAGLQPHEFVVDKFNQRGAERAEFDWESGIATLHGDQTAALDLPTFDILALMWQFYFQPPDADRQSFALATTRRIVRATVSRERAETIEWGHGAVVTEVWRRTSDDGKTDATVWLAPSLRWLPVKMRVANTTRGTVEAVLADIRVDESAVGDLSGDAPATPAPPPAEAPAPEPPPRYEHTS